MGSSGGGGGGGVPPGFRFHPTDEELLHYYLLKKISFHKFEMEVIREVDLNKVEPWDLQERCKIGSTPQNEWYFFSHKDRKYPTGSRTNRATNAGFWKATGRDKCIRNTLKKIGMRKTLVFYRGRAPHGQKTDWIMHEYRLEDSDDPQSNPTEDGWVVCRVFKKKNLFKIGSEGGGAGTASSDQINNTSSTHVNQHRHGFTNNNNNLDYHLQHQQPFDHHDHLSSYNKPELALNYSSHHHHLPMALPQYSQIHAQGFNIPSGAHKPMGGYDMISSSDDHSAPLLMVKQFMSSNNLQRDCDGGGGSHENLRYHQAAAAEGMEEGRLNEWGMMSNIDPNRQQQRLVLTSHGGGLGVGEDQVQEDDSSKGMQFEDPNAPPSSMHQINHLSLRGEMDLWGYGK